MLVGCVVVCCLPTVYLWRTQPGSCDAFGQTMLGSGAGLAGLGVGQGGY